MPHHQNYVERDYQISFVSNQFKYSWNAPYLIQLWVKFRGNLIKNQLNIKKIELEFKLTLNRIEVLSEFQCIILPQLSIPFRYNQFHYSFPLLLHSSSFPLFFPSLIFFSSLFTWQQKDEGFRVFTFQSLLIQIKSN